MNRSLLSREALERALHLRDLTDPTEGPHAMQSLVSEVHRALATRWGCPRRLHRAAPLVSLEENYDRLHYPPEGAARGARYTRYVTPYIVLRTQTSAMIPGLLRSVAVDPPDDLLLVCPGLVYRRDSIDRQHTGEPHQLDLWRVRRSPLGTPDLLEMIDTVVQTALPGIRYRTEAAVHPYTEEGLQIDVETEDGWIEVGECGLALPALLAEAGLDPSRYGGLAMGLGLDRLLMVRKGIDDIRLLRSADPRIAGQMLDLEPYRPVSDQPAIRRDLSVAVPEDCDAEALGDDIREALHDQLDALECVEWLGETGYLQLPETARTRMGMSPGQKNVLLRLVIRHPARTLTRHQANEIRDRVYRAVHRGERSEMSIA